MKVTRLPGIGDRTQERRRAAAGAGCGERPAQALLGSVRRARCRGRGGADRDRRGGQVQRGQRHRVDLLRCGHPAHRVDQGAFRQNGTSGEQPAGRRGRGPRVRGTGPSVLRLRRFSVDRGEVHHGELRGGGSRGGVLAQSVPGPAVDLPARRPVAQQMSTGPPRGTVREERCVRRPARPRREEDRLLPAARTLHPGVGGGQHLPVGDARAGVADHVEHGPGEHAVPAPREVRLVRGLVHTARRQQQHLTPGRSGDRTRRDRLSCRIGRLDGPRTAEGRVPGRQHRLASRSTGEAAVENRHDVGAAGGDLVEQDTQPLVGQQAVRADQGLIVTRRLDQQVRAVGLLECSVPGEPQQRGLARTRCPEPLADAALDRLDGRLPVQQDPHGPTGGASLQQAADPGDVVETATQRRGLEQRVVVNAHQK